MAPVPFNLVCFRLHPAGTDDEAELDRINENWLQRINRSGRVFLTQTRLNGRYTLRFVAGQTHTTLETVQAGWEVVREMRHATPPRGGD